VINPNLTQTHLLGYYSIVKPLPPPDKILSDPWENMLVHTPLGKTTPITAFITGENIYACSWTTHINDIETTYTLAEILPRLTPPSEAATETTTGQPLTAKDSLLSPPHNARRRFLAGLVGLKSHLQK